MTTTTWSVAHVQTTDAEFRAWGSAINAALTAIGLTNTTDTGQVNWGTVAKPAAINTAQGYEIWRLNDTEQASCPIFFKIEYGSGSATTRPCMWFTVGTGSDGAGTITGDTILARQVMTASAGTGDTTARTGYACYQDGGFWLSMGAAGATSIIYSFGFSRYCDASGTADATGGVWWMTTNMTSVTNASAYAYQQSTGTTYTGVGLFPMPSQATVTSHAYGSDVAVYTPVVWSLDGPKRVFGLLGAMKNDFTAGSTASITAFGSSRTFVPLTGASGPRGLDYAGDTDSGVLGVYS